MLVDRNYLNCDDPNRNLKIYKALLKSQAHQGSSLFTSAELIHGRWAPITILSDKYIMCIPPAAFNVV